MSKIVCATRGGEGSRAVQRRAVQLAREKDGSLIFLYVIDFTSLDEFDERLKPAVRTELEWLGRALLGMAHQRASERGLDVEIVIREGDVEQEIDRFLQEIQPELFLLGAPRGTTANVFGDDAIEQFAQSIQQETGVPVEVVRPEEIIE